MSERPAIRVITVSASYGAGGSVVAPRVAQRLGLPFVDRAIPASVAARLEVPLEDALSHDERAMSGFWRALAQLAVAGSVPDASGVLRDGESDRFRAQTEAVIRDVADTTGGVVLGRAGAIVLAGRPDTLRVRLDGAVDARVSQAARFGELDEAQARDNQRDFDRAWDGYVRRFYRADATEARHYDLVLDSTTLGLDLCVELIVLAAGRGTAGASGTV